MSSSMSNAKLMTLLLAFLVFCSAGVVYFTQDEAQAQAQPGAASYTITGVDLHDGMMLKEGNTYYLYGTKYACGFAWPIKGTPWCGFGVATAPSPEGPWSSPQLLFPLNTKSTYGLTWQQTCGDPGWGCFNPRMIKRSGWGANDGAWILWFNAPDDYNRVKANAYYSMGCNGPAGPCGPTAGAPFGSINKPTMYNCYGNGDYSLVLDNPRPPMMLCTMANQTISSERLSQWGTFGVGGGLANLAGAKATESPGAYRDPTTQKWIMTFNEPNCGYCAGTGTSFAVGTAINGPFTSPVNTNEIGTAAPAGRRMISGTSCGGQGRTVVELDGEHYQFIDLWLGKRNETNAGIQLERLRYNGQQPFGQPYHPFDSWTCT